jgi:hypothetical protein
LTVVNSSPFNGVGYAARGIGVRRQIGCRLWWSVWGLVLCVVGLAVASWCCCAQWAVAGNGNSQVRGLWGFLEIISHYLPLISEEKIDLVKPRTFSSSWLGSPISIHNRTHYSFFPSLHRSPDHSVLPDCHLSLPSITLAVPRASVSCRYFFLSVFSVEFS